jgi:hypothetical protein
LAYLRVLVRRVHITLLLRIILLSESICIVECAIKGRVPRDSHRHSQPGHHTQASLQRGPRGVPGLC